MTEHKVYLLLGPEQGEKSEYLNKIRLAAAKKFGGKPEEHKFYPYDTDAARIISMMQNQSLFSSGKLVMIYNADDLNAAQVSVLVEYCKAPSQDTILVFLSDEIKINQGLSKTISKDATVIFWEMFENKKRDWLAAYFRKAGKTPGRGVIELILELIENNTRDMKMECDKLFAYYAAEPVINEDLAEEFIYHSRVENIFSLFDRLVLLKFQEALDIYNKLVNSAELQPSQLVSSLYWQFNRLHKYVLAMDNGYDHEKICNELKINGKRNRKLMQTAASNYAAKDLAGISELLCEYDLILKEARGEMGRIQGEALIYYLSVKKAPPDALPYSMTAGAMPGL